MTDSLSSNEVAVLIVGVFFIVTVGFLVLLANKHSKGDETEEENLFHNGFFNGTPKENDTGKNAGLADNADVNRIPGIQARQIGILRKSGVYTVGQLRAYKVDDLKAINGIGDKSARFLADAV